MGTYSPADIVTPGLLARIDREITRPSVNAIADEGIDFRGTLFIGIMLTPDGPQVLEYNTRFGDPETQVVLPRLDTDLLALLWAAARGRLGAVAPAVRIRPEHAICVVIASKGYPGKFPKNIPIALPATLPPGAQIIHAGTARDASGQLVTAGGRVLGVTALAPTLREAAARAYAACEQIACATKYYRKDIGARALSREGKSGRDGECRWSQSTPAAGCVLPLQLLRHQHAEHLVNELPLLGEQAVDDHGVGINKYHAVTPRPQPPES
jgi:phosphoribosylamine--glycine ligase